MDRFPQPKKGFGLFHGLVRAPATAVTRWCFVSFWWMVLQISQVELVLRGEPANRPLRCDVLLVGRFFSQLAANEKPYDTNAS